MTCKNHSTWDLRAIKEIGGKICPGCNRAYLDIFREQMKFNEAEPCEDLSPEVDFTDERI